jgi:hypothetical protein
VWSGPPGRRARPRSGSRRHGAAGAPAEGERRADGRAPSAPPSCGSAGLGSRVARERKEGTAKRRSGRPAISPHSSELGFTSSLGARPSSAGGGPTGSALSGSVWHTGGRPVFMVKTSLARPRAGFRLCFGADRRRLRLEPSPLAARRLGFSRYLRARLP